MTSSILSPLSIEFHGFRFSEPAILVVPVLLAIIYFSITSLIWVYQDAELREKTGWNAVLFVLLTGWPLSFLWWFWLRPAADRHPINWKRLKSSHNRIKDTGRAIVFVQMQIPSRPLRRPEKAGYGLTVVSSKPLIPTQTVLHRLEAPTTQN
jgi:hypothetical protein